MKTFKDLKVGDKLFCIDVENLCLMVYEISNIVDSSFPKNIIYNNHRIFELLTIIGEKTGRFSVLQKDLKQSKQVSNWFFIFYADEKAAIRKLNVLIKSKKKSKNDR